MRAIYVILTVLALWGGVAIGLEANTAPAYASDGGGD